MILAITNKEGEKCLCILAGDVKNKMLGLVDSPYALKVLT